MVRNALFALACLVTVTSCASTEVRPQESVQFNFQRAVAEGNAPCKFQVFADGDLVFDLKSESTSVKCPLPHFVATPDAGPTDESDAGSQEDTTDGE